jgi:hypothetical protein
VARPSVIIGQGMKIKIGSWADYDFDKEDAKIAVPLILLLAGGPAFKLHKPP